MRQEGHQPVVVVIGVSGSGKSTVAGGLAEALEAPFAEADSFHPKANIDKMSAGQPLTDDDRWPWLRAIANWIGQCAERDGGVVTCSALKRRYRDLLRSASNQVWFLHLHGDRDLIAKRMSGRSGHFMPPELLDSQFADLEPLAADEPGFVADVAHSPERIVESAVAALRAWQGSRPA
ncbi:MAG: AAA family ATPase [Pseudonocardiaceae bacterium]|nr:AAA family ATPase [Pseudonocardiaceae bacterium]